MIYCSADRCPSHEGELLTFQGLERYLNSPVRSLNTPNSPEGLKVVSETGPDLMISIRYGRILHAEALSIPARVYSICTRDGCRPTAASWQPSEPWSPRCRLMLHSTGSTMTPSTQAEWLAFKVTGDALKPAIYQIHSASTPRAVRRCSKQSAFWRIRALCRTWCGSAGTYYASRRGQPSCFNQAGYRWAAPEFLTELFSRYLPQ